jgi:hypothetical protein
MEAGGNEDGAEEPSAALAQEITAPFLQLEGVGPSAEVPQQIDARVEQGSRQRCRLSVRQGTRRRGRLFGRRWPHLAGWGRGGAGSPTGVGASSRRDCLACRGWFQDAARRGELLAKRLWSGLPPARSQWSSSNNTNLGQWSSNTIRA